MLKFRAEIQFKSSRFIHLDITRWEIEDRVLCLYIENRSEPSLVIPMRAIEFVGFGDWQGLKQGSDTVT